MKFPYAPEGLLFVDIILTYEVRLILGQTNFFEYFEITFRGREKTFEILPYE